MQTHAYTEYVPQSWGGGGSFQSVEVLVPTEMPVEASAGDGDPSPSPPSPPEVVDPIEKLQEAVTRLEDKVDDLWKGDRPKRE